MLDRDDTYLLSEFTPYRNDFNQSNIRTCYGTALYIKMDLNCPKIPYRYNLLNNLEITVMVLSQPIPNIGIYGSKTKVTISQLFDALTDLLDSVLMESAIPTELLGDFNIDLQCNAGKFRTKDKQTKDALS